jgi:hypothetical protein
MHPPSYVLQASAVELGLDPNNVIFIDVGCADGNACEYASLLGYRRAVGIGKRASGLLSRVLLTYCMHTVQSAIDHAGPVV